MEENDDVRQATRPFRLGYADEGLAGGAVSVLPQQLPPPAPPPAPQAEEPPLSSLNTTTNTTNGNTLRHSRRRRLREEEGGRRDEDPRGGPVVVDREEEEAVEEGRDPDVAQDGDDVIVVFVDDRPNPAARRPSSSSPSSPPLNVATDRSFSSPPPPVEDRMQTISSSSLSSRRSAPIQRTAPPPPPPTAAAAADVGSVFGRDNEQEEDPSGLRRRREEGPPPPPPQGDSSTTGNDGENVDGVVRGIVMSCYPPPAPPPVPVPPPPPRPGTIAIDNAPGEAMPHVPMPRRYDVEYITALTSLANTLRYAYCFELIPPVVLVIQGEVIASALLPFPIVGFYALCSVRWLLQVVNLIVYLCLFVAVRVLLIVGQLQDIQSNDGEGGRPSSATTDYVWLVVQHGLAALFEAYVSYHMVRFVRAVKPMVDHERALLRWKSWCK